MRESLCESLCERGESEERVSVREERVSVREEGVRRE